MKTIEIDSCDNCPSNTEYMSLGIPGTDLTIQVKVEDEGIVIDIFDLDEEVIETTYKLWDELVNDNWGLKLLELLNKQHNSE